MSRAFLKNESADDPVFVPARAPLPLGAVNYVTPRGLSLLRTELGELESERAHAQTSEPDEAVRARQLAELNGRIANLTQRIASAKVVDIQGHTQDGIRFGATVSLGNRTNKAHDKTMKLTIVGVDEANATQGLIAFTAPIARLLLGKQVGESVALRTPQGENLLEIIRISYE